MRITRIDADFCLIVRIRICRLLRSFQDWRRAFSPIGGGVCVETIVGLAASIFGDIIISAMPSALLIFTLFFEGSVQEIYCRDAETDEDKEDNNRSAEATL